MRTESKIFWFESTLRCAHVFERLPYHIFAEIVNPRLRAHLGKLFWATDGDMSS